MPLPSLLFSFILASVIGLFFFIFAGRGWLGLLIYWLVSLIGFAVGEVVSRTLAFSLFPVGPVNVVEASLTSFIALLIAHTVWRYKGAKG